MALFLKILSGTSPFMITNTSATFLDIAKGEDCISSALAVRHLTLHCELEVDALVFCPDSLFVSVQSDVSLHVSCGRHIYFWLIRQNYQTVGFAVTKLPSEHLFVRAEVLLF